MPRLLEKDNVACFSFGAVATGSFPCACLLRTGGITRAATHHAAHKSIQVVVAARHVRVTLRTCPFLLVPLVQNLRPAVRILRLDPPTEPKTAGPRKGT